MGGGWVRLHPFSIERTDKRKDVSIERTDKRKEFSLERTDKRKDFNIERTDKRMRDKQTDKVAPL